ncbi:toxin-antitoxin system HicB family antitoxin [Tessaracoccus rhinocerotis]|uniref:Toxin-antitoxin system HicB family antitoxin n=1 Tax=Tessaracoccus rhinocerotis TaxID=1689449 RepID=A0A553JW95_9ACTN|nr:toxin-antitoxin system HicB family antitoxin [Tessaracoccus rhinocerotis]TRY16729.1 toxin-antitoxin system HicB family antitoxin [Tessaracoccus rhinocerotis]
MELTTYVERLRAEVSAATELGGPEIVAAAQRVLAAVDPAVRLVLLEALTDAAAEITTELPSGSIDARLRGRSVEFVLDGIAPHEEPEPSYPDQPEPVDEGGDQIRITLRLPEGLKTRAEELAEEAGQSLNSWLVDAVRDATTTGVRINLRGQGFNFNYPPKPPRPPHPGRRMTGWA